MSEFWTYQPRIVRRQRQRQQFEQQARQYAAQTVMTQQVADMGYDPDVVPVRPTMFTRPTIRSQDIDAVLPPRSEEKGGGGRSILGKVGGIIDDVSSTVFGGEIRQPWDLLRPVKRVLDAEQRYISKPLAKGLYEGVTGGDYEDAPGLLKFGLETLTSPSTFVGPGTVAKLAKGGTAVAGAMKISRFAQETDSRLMGGVADVANRITGAPRPIAGASSSAINAVEDTAFRSLLGGELPAPGLTSTDRAMNRLKNVVGIGTPDDELATPIMRARGALKQTADALSVRLSATAGKRVRETFRPNAAGRIESLPGAPTIQDVAARLPEFDHLLDDAQRGVLNELRDEMSFYNAALKEQGVDLGSRIDIMDGVEGVQDGGFYLPRGNATPKGTEDAAKLGVMGRGRGKAGYQKTASFESMMQGMDAGYAYEPFEDVLRNYSKRAGEDAIDAYTARTFKGLTDETGEVMGQSASDRLEDIAPGLKDRVEKLRQNISTRLDTLVRQQARGMHQSAAETRLNRLLAESEEQVQRAMSLADEGIAGSPEMARAEAVLNALDKEAARIAGATDAATSATIRTEVATDATQQAIGAFRTELDSVKGVYAKALERARATPRDAGSIGLTGLQGTSFPVEVANAANKFLRAEAPQGDLRGAVKVLNGLLRGFSATGDVSFIGIQGLLGLGHTPGSYGRAWKAAMTGLGDRDSLARYIEEFDRRAVMKGLPDSREWIKAGLHLGGIDTEYTIGQGIDRAKGLLKQSAKLGNAPIVKQSNRAFGIFGDSLRLDAAEVMRLANPDASLSELATAANLMTGWNKGRFLGDVGDFVQFAPRFFQSQLELVVRAMNPTDKSATAQQARWMFGKLMGIGGSLTVAANEATGGVTDFDPSSPNFMRIRAGGKDISLFGPWDSLVKATIRAGQGDFEYLARTKASPGLRMAWDSLVGENFIGEPTLNPLNPGAADPERVGNFLKNFLPFSAQDVVSGEALPTSVEGATGLGLNLAGVKAAPLSRADVLDDIARDAYDKGWDDLSAKEVSALAMKSPGAIDKRTVMRAEGMKKAFAEYDALDDKVWDKVNNRPELEGFATLDEYVAAKTQELVRMGVPPGQVARRLEKIPVIDQFHDAVNTVRRRYRLAHPDVDELLQDWRGLAPVKRRAG